MKDIFVILTISLVSVNWQYVESRYIPDRSRHLQVQRETGQLHPRGSVPGHRWTQQIHRFPGSNRMLKQQPYISSNNRFLIPQRLGLRTINSQFKRQHQYVHTRDIPKHGRQVNNASTSHSQHNISISINNGDEQSLITFRNKRVPPTITMPYLHSYIIRRPDITHNRIGNNALRTRVNVQDQGHATKRRPFHNILIKTKSGNKIKISHSLRNTNIILNASSFSSRGNSVSNSRLKSRSKTNAPDSNSQLEVKGNVQVNDVGTAKQQVPNKTVSSTNPSLANSVVSSEAATQKTTTTLVSNSRVFGNNGSHNVNRTTSISGGFEKQTPDTPPTTAHVSNTTDKPGKLPFTNAIVDKSNAKTKNINGTNNTASLTNNVQIQSASSKQYLTSGAVLSPTRLNSGNRIDGVQSVGQSEVGKTGDMTRDESHPESAVDDIDGIDVPDTPDNSDTDGGDK